jgi:cell division protein FtsL
MNQQFLKCQQQAKLIVQAYRDVAPKGCDPKNYVATTTLLIAAAVTAIIGAGVSAYGMYAQGQAQKKMADYNAKIQSQAATSRQQQAAFEADRLRERNRLLAGAQIAGASKSGLDISGSVSDVMNDSAVSGEMNALAAIYKGDVSASQYNASAELSHMQGQAAQEGSYYNAGGTLLSGIGQAGGYWGQANSNAGRMKGGNPTLN